MNYYVVNNVQKKEDPPSWQQDQGEQLAKLRGTSIQAWDQPVYIMFGLGVVLLINIGPIWKVRPGKCVLQYLQWNILFLWQKAFQVK